MDFIPSFIKGASNVYRTKNFIVKQVLHMSHNEKEGSLLMSHDTYYARTPVRDKQYMILFGDQRNVNGKRVVTAAYTRRYVD